jgi:cytochrome c-type biogenesis protein CcmH
MTFWGTLLVATLELTASQYAPQKAEPPPLAQADQEERVQRLGKLIRCPVCQGVSIADSPSSMARSQLDMVRQLVAAGKSDQEILAYFVERYDEWALLEPKREGFNWLVWLGPVMFVLIGLGLIARQVRREPRATVTPTSTPSKDSEPSVDPYLEKVRAELER